MRTIVVSQDCGILFNINVVVAMPTISDEGIAQTFIQGLTEDPIGSGDVKQKLVLLEDGAAWDVSDAREAKYTGEIVR